MALVNAGHVAPYLVRDQHVTALDLPVDLPLGLFADTTYQDTQLALEPATGSSSSPTACLSAWPSMSTSPG